jgi:glycine/D-amino acid oxidase-like deaminating enzyme
MTQRVGVAIVGGGIWGLSTAYHLARAGQTDACVLERNRELSKETTSQAAGLVGQIRTTPLMRETVRYAVELFSGFAQETGHDPGFRQVGSLLIALTPKRMESYEQQVEHANRNGVEAKFVDHAEMARLAPALDMSRVLGGYFVPKDGYLDPVQCARAYGAAAKDQGVEIRTGTRVVGLTVRDGRVVGVETDHGFVEAGQVIVTAGPWTGSFVAKATGFVPPMQPIRHQRATTVPVAGIPDYHPVVRATDVSCYVRPEKGGYLYGFFEPHPVSYGQEAVSPEFKTEDIEPPVDIMAEARNRLAPIFPVLKELEVAEYKRGLTTFAPDGAYLVGPVPEIENLYVATGCAALGIAGSPAVGRWLANWITKGNPDEDLAQVDLERFGAGASDREWIREASEEFYGAYYSIESMSVT